jgi:hypothetical protein
MSRMRGLASCLLALAPLLPASAADPPDAATHRDAVDKPAPPVEPRVPPVDISDRVIKKAIVDSKELMDDIVPVGRASFGSGGSTPQRRIDRTFKDAEIPSCLTTDALKFAPPVIGFVGFGGVLALPFWLNAIGTGKCRH